MSKCKVCNNTGYYDCPVLLMEQECYKCDAAKILSDEVIEVATQNAMNFGTPDISGKMTIEDGTVYFRDKFGHVSMMMPEVNYNAFVKQMKKKAKELNNE